ncbi:MAG: 2-oxoacid:acceptor oxidoreductase subunit alpha [Deltaproteobacteria bacterium]|nr:2-oxoacid:acceptor oxidoreductase subunit alpha [Deltaproteobacteria bacterium]
MSSVVKFVQGNAACAEAAMYAGLGFFAGYPITPSTEIAELLAGMLPENGGKFIQMEDEIASMCAIIGGSLAGAKTMTATSGPGYSLMQEALGYAIIAEVPCVVASVMRGGPSTGLPTKVSQGDVLQARWGTHGDHSIIALTASNIQDVFEVTVEAFNLAEIYRTPVVLLFDEVIGHMREKLVIPAKGEREIVERLRTNVPVGKDFHPYLPREDGRLPMSDYGAGHRFHVTGLFHDMYGFPTENPDIVKKTLHRLVDKIESKRVELARWKEYFLDDAETVLISYGSSARSALEYVEACRAAGTRKVGLLELQTIWPFPVELVRDKTADAHTVLVVEMNMGQLVPSVKSAVFDPDRVFLANRVDGMLITPADIDSFVRVIDGRGM